MAGLGLLLTVLWLGAPSVARAAVWSSCSTATTQRLGYTAPAPAGFVANLPSLVGNYVGSSYDASTTTEMWAVSAFSDANGKCTFTGFAQSVNRPDLCTIPAGQDFAFIYSWGRYDDPVSKVPAQPNVTPRVNGSYWRRSDNSWPTVYGNMVPGNAYYQYCSLVNTAGVGAADMPGSKYNSTRFFMVVAGTWHAGSSTWRLRSACYQYEGRANWGATREATVSPSGGTHLDLGAELQGMDYIYRVYRNETAPGVYEIKSDTDAGVIGTEVEYLESAVTTDAAAAAAIYAKAKTINSGVFSGSPDGASGGGSSTEGDADDPSIVNGFGEKWQQLLDWLTGTLEPVWELFAPVRAIDENDILGAPDDWGSW